MRDIFRTSGKIILPGLFFLLAGCGVPGDPGHCYLSIDWEYYDTNYRVSYYEDNNPETPDWEELETDYYYDCYPGEYEYYYESEDPYYYYDATGVYILIQNQGSSGGLLSDGLDGADTYENLFLWVDPDNAPVELRADEQGELRVLKLESEEWTLILKERINRVPKNPA